MKLETKGGARRMRLVAAACLAAISVGAMAMRPAVAQDASDAWAASVLGQMTQDEKFDLVRGSNPFAARPKLGAEVAKGAGYVKGVPRLGVPFLTESDASVGVANMTGGLRPGDVATALPSTALLASTWDARLVERGSAMIGAEARDKGFNVLLAGGVNLAREPRNGRNFEYFGEDPLLAGTLAGHAIRGVQSNHVMSTIKHFALNTQETGRTILTADMEQGALRESDLLAFEIGIEIGQPGSVMCAYNKINGVFGCENAFLLNDVLRRDWGYKGFVMSDWGAVHGPSIAQGLDQESGTTPADAGYFGAQLRAALAAGTVKQADLDQSVRRILRSIHAVGLADHPPAQKPIDYEANARVAQEVAEAGIVLLKNERQLLPIAASVRTILVVGGHADVGVLAGGGGSSQVNPVGGAALKLPAAFGKKLYSNSSPMVALRKAMPQARISFDDGSDPRRAAEAAGKADLVVVFGEQFTTETMDVKNLSLPDNQDALIAAVASANPATVVVLVTGGPVLMPWLDQVGAVLEAWYPGQRGGDAIARILTGQVNPSGRLAMTFPASESQLPNPTIPGYEMAGETVQRDLYGLPKDMKPFSVTYPEGANAGYRWFDHTGAKPLFPFGHGLSYTRFVYRNLRVAGGMRPRLSFAIANTGHRAGADVAQVYARVNGVKRLVGWSRVDLKPGESRLVSVEVDPRIMARFDVAANNWHLAAGTYDIEIGANVNQPSLKAKLRLDEQRIKP
ncbi:beta-glucosidase [Duganella sp. SG902]|uniref:glycoside hydrolase family 3 C-terminal domain-containing protein n=1 Tax=Duganella sp. SG902 TaxID=2587016 RepID=UPI00159DB95A|nr:glycoside hydrolase family 3 C-terminal domain-containing protein [Duganella sp. SG902]NVM77507.1 beta-glucosidase [Duganella sp. SG902]